MRFPKFFFGNVITAVFLALISITSFAEGSTYWEISKALLPGTSGTLIAYADNSQASYYYSISMTWGNGSWSTSQCLPGANQRSYSTWYGTYDNSGNVYYSGYGTRDYFALMGSTYGDPLYGGYDDGGYRDGGFSTWNAGTTLKQGLNSRAANRDGRYSWHSSGRIKSTTGQNIPVKINDASVTLTSSDYSGSGPNFRVIGALHTHNTSGTEYSSINASQHYRYVYCNGHGTDHSQNRSSTTENHSFGSWTTTTSATCVADGSRYRTCSKCNYKQTETLTKLGHNYSSAWTYDTGKHWHKCSRCSSISSEGTHTYSYTFKAGTTTHTRKCTVCGESRDFGCSYPEGTCSSCGHTFTSKNIIRVRYQNADGSFGEYADAVNDNFVFSKTCSWSRAMDDVYEAATCSFVVTLDPRTEYVDVIRRKSDNRILVRFQNADGSFGEYEEKVSGDFYVGQEVSWSYPEDNTYQEAVLSFNASASSRTGYLDVYRRVFRVVYDGNSVDSGVMSDSINIVGSDYLLSPNEYSRTGYVWTGWNTKADGTGASFSDMQDISDVSLGAESTPSADGEYRLVLYAQWRPIMYTIHYNTNGGDSGFTASSVHVYDSERAITTNGFQKSQYHFGYWNTMPDNSGVRYRDGELVENLVVDDGSVVEFYAQWSPLIYHLRYEKNGGDSGVMQDSDHLYDNADRISLNHYGRTGYRFNSWNTKADGTGTAFSDGEEILNLTDEHGRVIVLYAQWEPISYTLHFDVNPGNGSSIPVLVDGEAVMALYDADTVLTARAERAGYKFLGWNTKADGTGIPCESGGTCRNLTNIGGSEVTLYAQWEPASLLVEYMPNFGGGTGSGSMTDSVFIFDKTESTAQLKKASFVKRGFDFSGWNSKPDGTGMAFSDEEIIRDPDMYTDGRITLYAQWKEREFTVNYYGNGATAGIMPSNSFRYDDSLKLDLNVYIKRGCRFLGWNTRADGTGTSYKDREGIMSVKDEDSSGGVLDLYAQWSGDAYRIRFDGNKGAGSSSPVLKNASVINTHVGTVVTLEASAEREGYDFLGWNTNANGSGKLFRTGDSVQDLAVTEGVVVPLYAQWRAKNYEIKFDPGEGEGGMLSIKTAYDKTVALPACSFEKSGYEFAGWSLAKNGDAVYKDGQSVRSLSSDGGTVTLYAVWQLPRVIEYYYLYFNGNACDSGSMDGVQLIRGDKYRIPVCGFGRSRCVFKGWNTQADGSGQSYLPGQEITDISGGLEAATLYAVWETVNYTVSFDLNTEDGSSHLIGGASFDQAYGDTDVLGTSAGREGYTFAGWNTRPDGTGVQYAPADSVTRLSETNGAVVKLYAVWEAHTYTIRLESGVSGIPGRDIVTRYGEPVVIPEKSIERTGYVSIGWSDSPDGDVIYVDGATVSDLSPDDGGVYTLYAKWRPITYTVSFSPNGGKGSMTKIVCTYDEPVSVPTCTFTATARTFAGWSRGEYADVFLSDGGTIRNLIDDDNGDVVLYAQWLGSEYYVAFDPNGGSGSMDPITLVIGKAKAAPECTFVRNGYKADSWNTKADGTGKKYLLDAALKDLTLTADETVVLYMQWKPYTYSLVFHENKGEADSYVSLNNTAGYTAIPYDRVFTLSASASRDGYNFVGWNTSADGSGTAYDFGHEYSGLSSGDGVLIDLYAQWEAGAYTVSYDLRGGSWVNGGPAAVSRITGDSVVLPGADDVFRNGYAFAGWSLNPSGIGEMLNEVSGDITRNVTVYAVWVDIDGHADGLSPHISHVVG